MSRDKQGAFATSRTQSPRFTGISSRPARTATEDDPLLHDALLFQFVVVGEAVKTSLTAAA
jgi:hypothetical protein